jgi:hypothetical protein
MEVRLSPVKSPNITGWNISQRNIIRRKINYDKDMRIVITLPLMKHAEKNEKY